MRVRLFVGIFPPPPVVVHLAERVAALRVGAAAAAGARVRLADPEQAHLTVAFLGEVAPEARSELDRALGRAAGAPDPGGSPADADAGAGAADPGADVAGPGAFSLRLGGGGRFGWGPATVLWVDVRGERDRLTALAGRVRTELTAIGTPVDERPYRPHLTIARPGDRLGHAEIEADVADLAGYLGPPWPVTELVLVESRFDGQRSENRRGPEYRRLAAWPLGRPGG